MKPFEDLRDYLSTPSPPQDFKERLGIGFKIFLIVGSVVFVIFQFNPRFSFIFSLFYAWIVVGLSFGVTFWVLGEIEERWLRRWTGEMNYGKQWVIVFFQFLICWKIYLMIEAFCIPLLFPEYFAKIERDEPFLHFLRVLPIWFIVTYLIFEMEIKKTLTQSLQQAQQINRLLAQKNQELSASDASVHADEGTNSSPRSSSGVKKFQIFRNNQTEALDPAVISHISVEEHYSSIFVKTAKEVEEIQVRLSLKEALNQLPPDSFVRIHRSHVINLSHVSHVEQTARSYQIFLGDNDFVLPLSRHRVSQVLPVLQEYLKTD